MPCISLARKPLVRSYSEHFKVVVVTGPRQVGKTTMLKHLMEEDASAGIERAYATLDNTAILQAAKEDPALFLQRYRPPVLIDEIQKAPQLPEVSPLYDSLRCAHLETHGLCGTRTHSEHRQEKQPRHGSLCS